MNLNYQLKSQMNSQTDGLTNAETLLELNNDELDAVSGGRDIGGRRIGSFIHRRVEDARDTVVGFAKGILFG